ncbi:hypothetical protein [Streptomyces sp. NPDC057428]|uniref:hypothetical protein n=1 Tax=Streptomyces sp. NPDC057428 TaxID=3346129 RepID=UPI00368DE2FA
MAELPNVFGRRFDDGLDLAVGQPEVFQCFGVQRDAENVARQGSFPHAAVCGALPGRDQAMCVHPKGGLLVIGLLFSRHEHQDETASILTLGKSGFGEVAVRVDLGPNGAGGKSVCHDGVLSVCPAVP